ncbi:xylose isomerase-like enzyme [Nostoc sp. PCC 7524]|uniref:sugar phosphate isomerase/epimerase family protein n=1 Tax=Nostoc sp. (strain ATCC 29411 / PCC 7524) TaxID=28072 RepID=UPI00029EE476|nr:TIM barrel protein [Nostoc sp. PCC 7524]AFY46065.1 xylose isomerase-like enzyme [Nostoc sp. PCC 7524]
MEFYLSLSAYGGVSTREALTVFWEAGIRYVELAIGPKPDTDAVQAIQDFRQQGMVYRAHHAFVWGDRHYPFNLAQPQDWNYFQRLTDWLANNGITAYSVHGGHFPMDTNRAEAYATFLENVHCLHQQCLARGIVLGVETMYPTLPTSGKENLLDNASEVAQFCQDAPEVKIVLDLAHLNIWHHHSLQAKLQWLKLPPGRLLEIHISDNDGRHDIHSRITQKTWWVSQIAQFPTGVPFVLESRLNRLPVSAVQQECDWLRQALCAPSHCCHD